jgi:acetyl-CoA synthetase
VFSLKPAVDAALRDMPQCPVTKVITLDTKTTELPAPSARDVSWAQAIEGCPAEFAAVSCDSEDPLFILYTSGSTGSPKGIVHTQAGYMVWVAYTFANVFQVDESSIHWCTADLGWITGHSYIAYAPLLLGTTTMMFEGVPTWPNASRLWQAVERHSVTHFYTAPTLIRSLQACDESLVASSNRSSLKVLGTVGEPINASAWQWYFEVVGNSRCPVVDTWWQTETGGIMIAPLAGLSPLRPTYAGLPLPGVLPMLVDDNGREVADTSASGNLCISRPWPGMMRTIFGNFERFLNGYLRPFPGHYFSGDGAMRDVDGLYRVTGRVDDVLNVSGHRLGTAEIENAINKHPALVESAVVGIPDAVTGQSVFAFVVIDNAPGTNEERGRATTPSGNILLAEVQAEVTKHIGALAKPRQVIAVSGLPKTRSGKIMRRILRAIALGESDSLGDTSTLINPEVVTAIVAAVKQAKGAGTV